MPPSKTRASAPPSFEALISNLQEAYGADEVVLGTATPESAVNGLEGKLGVRLPEDYRAFVRQYGFLRAGPLGNVIVYGVAGKARPKDYEVRIVDAAKRLHAELEGLIQETPKARAALAPGLKTAPFLAWGEDFPHHQVQVFDKDGRARWFLVKEASLDAPSGQTFTGVLSAAVAREVKRAAENREQEAAEAERKARGPARIYDVRHCSGAVLKDVEKTPVLGSLVWLCPSVGELRAAAKDPKGWELTKDEAKQVTASLASRKDADEALVEGFTCSTFLPAVAHVLTGGAPAAPGKRSPLEVGLYGAKELPTRAGMVLRLIPAAELADAVKALRKARPELKKRLKVEEVRRFFDETDKGEIVGCLELGLDDLLEAYTEALEAGHAALIVEHT